MFVQIHRIKLMHSNLKTCLSLTPGPKPILLYYLSKETLFYAKATDFKHVELGHWV